MTVNQPRVFRTLSLLCSGKMVLQFALPDALHSDHTCTTDHAILLTFTNYLPQTKYIRGYFTRNGQVNPSEDITHVWRYDV